jgi:hypothetical protein
MGDRPCVEMFAGVISLTTPEAPSSVNRFVLPTGSNPWKYTAFPRTANDDGYRPLTPPVVLTCFVPAAVPSVTQRLPWPSVSIEVKYSRAPVVLVHPFQDAEDVSGAAQRQIVCFCNETKPQGMFPVCHSGAAACDASPRHGANPGRA